MQASIIKLSIAALLPVIASVILYLCGKVKFIMKLPYWLRQGFIGIVFGGLAIIGTEWGIPFNGATANCRDAAVLSAGLLFGGPAGIIAGLIGGIERWFTAVGNFTRIACTVSTILAGLYAALLRKFMFENKKPGWLLAMAIGVVMEIFHLTMVFITNMATPTTAMAAVKACTFPMVLANGISVMLSTMALSLLSGELFRRKASQVRISQTIQRWLLVTVLMAFAATSFFVFRLQDTIARRQADSLLDLALDEVSADISDAVAKGGNVNEQIVGITKNRHVGENGFIIIVDAYYNVISIPKDIQEEKLKAELYGVDIPDSDITFSLTVNEEPSFCRYQMADGYFIVSILPESEALQMRNIALYVNAFMEILVFAILFGLIYLLIKSVVVNQIKSINASLGKITEGDLGVVVNVRTNAEFASLSDDINSTVDTLKRYIAEASARIDKELEFAKEIQSSALPDITPALAKREEFEIFALMDPAKEVGGDFYDFYLTQENRLHFLIADVSGKGIPAAMFMMRAKTELRSLTEADLPIEEVFTHGNNALCAGNDAGMFVTAWQGDLDLTNGLVRFANAGHNPPLVRRGSGDFEFLRTKAGFVLAGVEDLAYQPQELALQPGDVVFLYTDGVTEATDAQEQLYGEERLLAAANGLKDKDMASFCRAIKADVEAFVGDAPQFDDITMVALQYRGRKE